MKKKYEVVREIFNKCSGNQMRDIFIKEIEMEDPKAYLLGLFPEENAKFDFSMTKDGAIACDVVEFGLRQKFTFTEI